MYCVREPLSSSAYSAKQEATNDNIPTTPNVYCWSVSFFTKQQLWRPVPQRYHFVGVRPLLVIWLVQPSKAKVGQFQLTTTITHISVI